MISKNLILWTWLIIGYCLFTTNNVLCESVCEPAEEGQQYNISCSVPDNGSNTPTYRWKDGNNVSALPYCICFPHLTSVCTCQPGYNGTVQGPVNGVYTSVFTINSPNKNQAETTFFCERVDDSKRFANCSLKVFVRAENPRCDVQDPSSTSNPNVVVTCNDDNIFPGAACQFNKKTNTSSPSTLPNSDVTIDTTEKTCTLSVAGTYLGRGAHQFSVDMYPNITDVNYGKTSGYTDAITIGDPSAELRDCPTEVGGGSTRDDYIMDGTDHTCTCTRTDQTYFPVDISWNGGTVSSVSQQPQSATLSFKAAKNQAFTCSVTNSLKWTKTVTYTPQVAYGPISGDVTLEPSSQGPVDLCQAGGVSFTVQCKVSSVVPSATFSYTANTTTSSGVPASGTTSTATVTAAKGGTYNVYYSVKNSVFPVIQADSSVSVVVREPPSAPIIEIFQTSRVSATSGDTLTVEEGGANVTCHVIGGYPQVTGLRLSCGEDKPVTSTNNQAQMTVSFTRRMNGESCSCMATHDSTCYMDNTVSYILDVLFLPAVKTFSVGNMRNVTVENGTTQTFVCEGEGNPRPVLSLQHDGGEDLKGVTTDGDTTVTSLTHNLPMDCLDTGVYTCTAQARGMEDKSTVEVFVLCPQQLESSQSQNTVYKQEINSTFSINVTVYGYPKPTLPLQLHGHKEDLQQDNYAVTYTETRPPHGTVTLTFYSLTEKYFQNYTLNVTNNKGSLVYYFTISDNVGSSDSDMKTNVGAIVGGVIAGIVVILLVTLAVFIVQRRGKMSKFGSRKSTDQDTSMHTLSSVNSRGPNENFVSNRSTNGALETAGTPSYENVVPTIPTTEKDGTVSYQNVVSSTTRNTTVRGPNYENSLSFSHVSPSDDNGMLKDQFSNASNVEYENTIQSL